MEINEIRLYFVTLPFVGEFSHSLRNGDSSKNVIVEVIAEGGEVLGYGEGAPRPYVTGESQTSISHSVKLLLNSDPFPWRLQCVSQIWDFVDGLQGGKEHNSALCALEMAMLDAVAKAEGQSVIDYFQKDFVCDTVHYGAAFPLGSKRQIVDASTMTLRMGIRRVKLKMGADFVQNRQALEGVRGVFGGDCDLKVDVNGAWNRELAFRHVPLAAEYGIRVIEQPLMPNDADIGEVAKKLKSMNVKVMADESACSFHDVKTLVEQGHFSMVNVRLSKCGGFRRSLRIIDFLRNRGVPFQIACQLGESGLLSAAGRILSLLCKDALYHDGSYDEFLLKENVTTQNVSFGLGGKAGPLGGVGLGVEVNASNLRRMSCELGAVTFRRP
jgi:L-Ala-D/L-Glu epimerase